MNNLKVKVGDRVMHKSTGSKMIILDIKKWGVEIEFDESTPGGWKGSIPMSYFEHKFEIDKQFNREQKINSLLA